MLWSLQGLCLSYNKLTAFIMKCCHTLNSRTIVSVNRIPIFDLKKRHFSWPTYEIEGAFPSFTMVLVQLVLHVVTLALLVGTKH